MYVDELIHKLKIIEEELQKIKDELMHAKEHINIYIIKNKKEERKQRVMEDKKMNHHENRFQCNLNM